MADQKLAGYLLSSFNRYWTYDAGSHTLAEVTAVMPDGCTANSNTSFGGYAFSADFGGVIMSDASNANAMGVYGISVGQGGSVSYLSMFKFFCWGMGLLKRRGTTRPGAPYMQPEQFPRAKLPTTCT